MIASRARLELARAHVRSAALARAAAQIAPALAHADAEGALPLECYLELARTDAALSAGDVTKASEIVRSVEAVVRSPENLDLHLRLLATRARVIAGAGPKAYAIKTLRALSEKAHERGLLPLALEIDLALRDIATTAGHPEIAAEASARIEETRAATGIVLANL
ncbi:MAG: hypothetical protein U0166_10510 [Acidobacteriota bacterium]